MTKSTLISKISEQLKISKKDTENFFNCLYEQIVKSLKDEEKIIVPKLGIIKLVYREKRTCKVPKSSKIVEIPAKYVPIFKMNSKFKESFTDH
ncbi:HU family DNA-binding protein [Candidatus Phytoplasma melaleucae]|uniref:HU family DNA-binding protein n=1 Tax=Candidatus Phytoplasma melaleucae TaxID=2982630 RepID=A0ABT9DDF0_9MOLU|nr:HU family DNA-binding protein ['Melaleuca sp.' phytoplasma]MDO8168077.1 HU family DNA-binding protein ['Melaleuca sp.' phytoplasma]MDV3205358.1 HU family DNA-binding protein [Weeping tea tree witches'-broom phytoplasma]